MNALDSLVKRYPRKSTTGTGRHEAALAEWAE